MKMGSFLKWTGKPADAISASEKALAMQRKLAEDNPKSAYFQRLLAYGITSLGMLRQELGDWSEALAAYNRALQIHRKLADAEPKNNANQRGIGRCLNNIGVVQTMGGHVREAIRVFEEACSIHETLARDYPTVAEYQYGLAFSLSGLGRAMRSSDRPAEVVQSLRRAINIWERISSWEDAESRYECAGDHALLATMASNSRSGLLAAEGPIEADRAIDGLKSIVTAGLRLPASFRTDPVFDGLNDRPDFRLLLMDFDFPAEPFAHGSNR
jgi:tetratricopeptide (TPR) repeat protein